MLAPITGQPHYQRVAADLRAKILDGTYPIDSPLPSTKKLMETYGVSLTVVRNAVSELRVEGVVMGQPGKAVYVVREPNDVGHAGSADLAHQVAELTKVVHRLDSRLSALEAERSKKSR